ncbi:HipA family kinase [Rossellomorea aquimaris]|uniref:HipA-like kinase domain-containing protein n=1 Tax=Rossellomorea aquimaris TaxID=189382 RepID=A0A1J6W8X6_9BACI|nr:HipA family kinase [Rossellomorea aquimaris]OIU73172.1 hypothetical protein BHE18_14945 [Rossellomorea aquimaris]
MIPTVEAKFHNKDIIDVDGSCYPKCYFCDDNETYVVKFQNVATKILPNEYISYLLARHLELPVYESKLINIDSYILDEEHLWLGDGIQFGVKYDKNAIRLNSKLIFKINNVHDIARIIVFDQWINNLDRGLGYDNWLMTPVEDHYILNIIDHSDVFGGKGWTGQNIYRNKDNIENFSGRQATYNDLFEKISQPVIEEINSFAQKISEFDNTMLLEIIESVPTEWRLGENDKKSILLFLRHRKELIVSHVSNQKKLIEIAG